MGKIIRDELMSDSSIKIDWLKGTKVLLIAHYLPGPLAAYLLKGLGAEVIKVEPPFGDLIRVIPPFLKGEKGKKASTYFRALNGGFKSIVANFKTPEGIEVLRDLIANCDVVIDGNRAGYLEGVLGARAEDINKNIIYIPITGYGLKGPMCNIAAHDSNILSLGGNLSYTPITDQGTASMFGAQIADITAGYITALVAVSSLLGKKNKESSEKINTVDVSIFHAGFFLNQLSISEMNVTKMPPKPTSELLNGGFANYKVYKTKDGKSLFLGPLEPNLFNNLCHKVDRTDLIPMLFTENERLKKELDVMFGSKTLDEWKDLLKDCDCCFAPVNDLQEAINEPQTKALGLVRQIKDDTYGPLNLAGFPAGFSKESLQPKIDNWAPELGEHTEEVLRDILNYDSDKIALLVEKFKPVSKR